MRAVTDEELMEEFVATRDPRMLSELARRYLKPAHAVACSYLFNASVAEDAVQEAFLKIMRSAGTFRTGEAFAPWFYRVLRNVCIDSIRRKKLRLDCLEKLANEPPAPGSHFAARVESDRALSRLERKERQVLALKINHRLTFGEIASAVGCSPEAAKKRAQRGLQKLRKHLSGRGNNYYNYAASSRAS